MVAFEHDRLGAFDVVKVGVDHRRNGACGVLAKFAKRGRHFLDRLSGVNRNNSVWSFNKGLVGKSVPDKVPHSRTHLIETAREDVALGDVVAMSGRARRCRHGVHTVVFKAPHNPPRSVVLDVLTPDAVASFRDVRDVE